MSADRSTVIRRFRPDSTFERMTSTCNRHCNDPGRNGTSSDRGLNNIVSHLVVAERSVALNGTDVHNTLNRAVSSDSGIRLSGSGSGIYVNGGSGSGIYVNGGSGSDISVAASVAIRPRGVSECSSTERLLLLRKSVLSRSEEEDDDEFNSISGSGSVSMSLSVRYVLPSDADYESSSTESCTSSNFDNLSDELTQRNDENSVYSSDSDSFVEDSSEGDDSLAESSRRSSSAISI